jgi:hypothetical protein
MVKQGSCLKFHNFKQPITNDMKKPGYACPYCSSKLDVDDKLILAAKTDAGQRGLILLSTTLGDYSVTKNDSFHLTEGELVEISCSVCQHSLADYSHPNLSKLISIDEYGKEHTLLFSSIVGERCTLLKKGEKIITYGEQAMRFQDPDWYLQEI